MPGQAGTTNKIVVDKIKSQLLIGSLKGRMEPVGTILERPLTNFWKPGTTHKFEIRSQVNTS